MSEKQLIPAVSDQAQQLPAQMSSPNYEGRDFVGKL